MGVYERIIVDHWDDWHYFDELGMSRSEYDWMKANLTKADFYSLSRLLWDTWDFSNPRGLYYVLPNLEKSHDLAELVDKNILLKIGDKKATYYILK